MILYRCDLIDRDGQVPLRVPIRRKNEVEAIAVGQQVFALCAYFAAFELWHEGLLIYSETRPPGGLGALPPAVEESTAPQPRRETAMLSSHENLRDLAQRYSLLASADEGELKPWQVAWLCWWQFIGRRNSLHKKAMTPSPNRSP